MTITDPSYVEIRGDVERAIRSYFREADRGGNIPEQPSRHTSGGWSLRGRLYVVLSNGRLLAVYRLRNDNRLKKLSRWPRALEEV
jgi:hypothetical protein